ISNASVNVANAAQPVPDAVRTARPPAVNVTTMQLAPGVWLLAGGSHNSVAVEFRDYITVIEGPLDDERSNAVIAAAKRVIPNKPIRYLVNTHDHWDHGRHPRVRGRGRHHRHAGEQQGLLRVPARSGSRRSPSGTPSRTARRR